MSSDSEQSKSQLPNGMQDSGRSQMPNASSEPETEPEAALEEPSLATHASVEPDPEATVEEPSPEAGQPTEVGPEDEATAEEVYVTFDSSVELGLESEATVLEPSFAADQHPQPLETNEIDVQAHEDGDSKNTQPIDAEGLNSPPRDVIEEKSKNGDAHVEQSNEAVKAASKLENVEGNRTFTMRELLNVMNNGDINHHDERDVDTPKSYAASEHQIEQNNAAMDLINSVNPHDEEGRSRQRILTFAAKRYATALEKNPGDHDALYNWALVLQESADNVSPESTSPSKDALLEEACRKYEEATRLCPSLNDAYYNWAIAISDRAKMRGRTKEAEELWKQATKNYEKAVQLNWNSPQALNNWGLALQELSAIVSAREKHMIVKTAVIKFRAAIQLQFDFHRAIYNLGTVLYGLAEDIARIGGFVNTQDVSPDELYSQSAIYIAAAHALKPSYSVYSSALKLVRSMLPLPFLKVGYLTAPPSGSSVAPHSDWKRSHFVLNHETLLQIDDVEQIHSPPGIFPNTTSSRGTIRINIPDIVSVSACADLILPPGAGLCIDTINETYYMVADSWESLDRWIDAIRLVYTIFARGKTDVLAGVITA